jgi:putative transposase
MARIARVVVPGLPHHIVQRGNRCQKVFFSDEDYKTYLDYLKIYTKPAGIDIWAYCLMGNHVHVIGVPKEQESLALGFSEIHRRYTRLINFRQGWRGYLWEGRFKSYPLSQKHLFAAMRYIETNPVRAGIVKNAWEYPWSSARAHVFKRADPLLDDNFIISEVKDWKAFLSEDNQLEQRIFKNHADSGRPLGSKRFIKNIEKLTNRILIK